MYFLDMILFSFMSFVLLLLGTLLIFVTRCLVLVTGCTCVSFFIYQVPLLLYVS